MHNLKQIDLMVAQARAQLSNDPIQRGKIPVWFRAAIKHAGYTRRSARELPRWADHVGVDLKHQTFVCEPYDLNETDLAEIAFIAVKGGLTYWLTGVGHWHPNTIRINFKQKPKVDVK